MGSRPAGCLQKTAEFTGDPLGRTWNVFLDQGQTKLSEGQTGNSLVRISKQEIFFRPDRYDMAENALSIFFFPNL